MLLSTILACAPTDGKADDSAATTAEALPVNRACLVPMDAVPEDYTRGSYVIEVFGRIREVGTGEPPGGCRDRDEWVGVSTVDWGDAQTWWVELYTAEGDSWIAAATNPWIPDPTPLKKLEVRVSYRSFLGDPATGDPAETEMTFEGEAYGFYLGAAGDLSAFEPMAETTFEAGSIEAEWDDDCGHHARRALAATYAGETAEIATDDTHGFGGVAIWSGGVVEDVTSKCPEAPSASASVFQWRVE